MAEGVAVGAGKSAGAGSSAPNAATEWAHNSIARATTVPLTLRFYHDSGDRRAFVIALASPPAVVYVEAGRLFDGVSWTAQEDVVLVIEDDRVVQIAPRAKLAPPAGARVIDLRGKTVLPGLIDCHVHLDARQDHDDDIWSMRDTTLDAAFLAVRNAGRVLRAGFTTVRDVGSPAFLAVDLRDRIEEGIIEGPRIVASGPMITITGGHGDLNGFPPTMHDSEGGDSSNEGVIDGPNAMRVEVRRQIKHGVDVIKIAASGGVFSRGDTPGAQQLTAEEMGIAVEIAHLAGRKVAAHAHGTKAIIAAVNAGVDSIEHGSFLDDEAIRAMKAHGTWLDADIYNGEYTAANGAANHVPEEFMRKDAAVTDIQRASFRAAVKAGVKISFGTDAGVYPQGDGAKQFSWMVREGMTPAAAIRSATTDAAELLGRADVGSLAPGKRADLIAIDGDPLKDVRLLEHVSFVMKGGAVIARPGEK